MKKLDLHVHAWEKDYKARGATWRGTTNFSLQMPKGSRVLELGCGNGKNVSSLSRNGFELHAIDSSPTALKLCSELVERVGGKATLKQMDARSLEYEDDYFDAVVCFHVLDHLLSVERKKAVSEAIRVLKKGGRLYFRAFAEGDMREGKGKEVEARTWQRGNGIVYHYFNCEEARALFAGLKEEQMQLKEWTVHYIGRPWLRREVRAEFIKAIKRQALSNCNKEAFK